MRAILWCLFSLISFSAIAQEAIDPASMKLTFASKEDAASLLATEDDFVKRLSPFDRAARLKADDVVDQATYLKFVSQQTLDWTDTEKATINASWQRIVPRLAGAKINVPPQITMIKTTGLEEGNTAYTRGTSIILPTSRTGDRGLDALMAHELFHVLSRNDAQMRERLYKIIGFRKCGELELPPELKDRRMTNPDGPINDHCIEVTYDGKQVWVVPVLFAKVEKYEKQAGGEFFSFLDLALMAIESPETPGQSKVMMEDGKPLRLGPLNAKGFLEQIGKNTGYIIHPDEVLADNFSMWITKRKVPQPELLEKIEKALKQTP